MLTCAWRHGNCCMYGGIPICVEACPNMCGVMHKSSWRHAHICMEVYLNPCGGMATSASRTVASIMYYCARSVLLNLYCIIHFHIHNICTLKIYPIFNYATLLYAHTLEHEFLTLILMDHVTKQMWPCLHANVTMHPHRCILP